MCPLEFGDALFGDGVLSLLKFSISCILYQLLYCDFFSIRVQKKPPYNVGSILINKLFLCTVFYLNNILTLLKQFFAKPTKCMTQTYD